MSDKNTEILEREIFVEAQPETVFHYFTDSEKMISWKGRQARLDPRPGGEYWVDINGTDRASGTFLELQPFDRIVFTWGWEAEGSPLPPGASTVEVLFIPQNEGTLVRLRHFDLEGDNYTHQAKGWDFFLPHLADAVRP